MRCQIRPGNDCKQAMCEHQFWNYISRRLYTAEHPSLSICECRNLWKPKNRTSRTERASVKTPLSNPLGYVIHLQWHLWHNLIKYINSILAWIVIRDLTLHPYLWHLYSSALCTWELLHPGLQNPHGIQHRGSRVAVSFKKLLLLISLATATLWLRTSVS